MNLTLIFCQKERVFNKNSEVIFDVFNNFSTKITNTHTPPSTAKSTPLKPDNFSLT